MEEVGAEKCLSRRRSATVKPFRVKDERVATLKKVASILQKSETDRTHEEKDILLSCGDVVKEVNLRQEKRDRVKARLEEVEDVPEILEEKCMRLAAALSRATSLAVYTGAGISTAASIPDYRGTNGVWTRLQQGKEIGNHDLSQAEPTLTHMALYALYKARVLKHIVSQNCDGLHLRSGIPRTFLSEVHGDMYIEVCRTCKPNREYWRLFDVTEKTARYSHGTGRMCHKCNSMLQDSIVHFGERGNLSWPINWNGASRAAKQADIILCLGSSLKVLKKYPWLWQMDRPVNKRPALYIVNLQWTPKDENAVLKINGRCDEVMKKVMAHLGLEIAHYNRAKDPIFHHAIRLQASELPTTSQPFLEEPSLGESEGSKSRIDNQKSANEIGGGGGEGGGGGGGGRREGEGGGKEEGRGVVDEREDEKPIPKTEEDCNSQITTAEPMAAYPAPFFTALPFLSMGLPFPPMYMYPHLTPFFYYPFIQVPPNRIESPKPKPACSFCMENEGSLTCLFYQRDGDDPVTTDPSAAENAESELDARLEPIQEAENESLVLDPTTEPIIPSVKNPGWFGKGYRKGMRKKR